MQRCKGYKGNKEPKQANTQTKPNQTKPKTAKKHHTQKKPLQRVKQVRQSSHGTSETGAMRHLSQASYAAPRARMAGELLTRKLSCLMGQIQSATKANQTKQKQHTTPNTQTKTIAWPCGATVFVGVSCLSLLTMRQPGTAGSVVMQTLHLHVT